MARPFIPQRLESPQERDDRIAKEIFTRIEDGGERIAQITAAIIFGLTIGSIAVIVFPYIQKLLESSHP